MNQYQIFESLLSKPIPAPPNMPVTFLEVARMPHYEVVISRIYQFYLIDSEEHGFKDLFLSSLINLIKRKWAAKNGSYHSLFDPLPAHWEVQIEVSTKKGNRIDILIEWEDDAGKKHCIIIENKVLHVLKNDLEDYYTTPEALPENKIGILLTLNKQEANHPKFINITHDEWLEEVKTRLGTYMMDGVDRHLFFIRDFILNLSKFTKNKKYMNDFSKFYFQQPAAIEQLVKARNIFVEEVFKAYQNAGDLLELPTGGKRAENYQYLIKEKGELLFTLAHNPDSDAPFVIIYDVMGTKLERKNALRAAAETLIKQDKWKDLSGTNWENNNNAHIVLKSYRNFGEEGQDLVDFFRNEISSIWLPLAEELEKVK